VDEYKEQLSGVGDQMKQLQEAVKRQQDELQAIQRRAELGMVINAGHGNGQPAPQVVVNEGLPKSQMALQVSTTVNEVLPNSLLAPQANTTVSEGHPDSETTPRVNITVDEGPQNSQLVNEGPPNTRLAPQVRPNMATYRDGKDIFMDGESETSDEFYHAKAGKRRENVESDDDDMLVLTDLTDDKVSLEPVEVDHLC
jgi:hypothetical protein